MPGLNPERLKLREVEWETSKKFIMEVKTVKTSKNTEWCKTQKNKSWDQTVLSFTQARNEIFQKFQNLE